MSDRLSVTRPAAALLVALACASAATGQERGDAAISAVQKQLEQAVAGVPRGTQVGLVVEDARDGRRWFAHNADTPMKPASTRKLLVTAASLERFGPGFAFETRVLLAGRDLLVIGSGDPGIGDERLEQKRGERPLACFDEWAEALRAAGATAIENIVLDDSIFDQQWRHPDWPDEQYQEWYQAPVGGLNLNDNCVDATARAAEGGVTLALRPPLPNEFIVNELKPGGSNRVGVTREAGSDVLRFSGIVRGSAGFEPVAVERPTLVFGYALREALRARGITVSGKVLRQPIDDARAAAARPIATHRTPLADVLWRSNTFSQNLFAECLLKALSAYGPDGRRSGRAGSWEDGVRVELAALQRLGVDLRGATLRDGSGLSHSNRVTAAHFTHLLRAMRAHRHAAVFVESLAVAGGEDGTMRRRFAAPSLRGRLRGKTGSIQGVAALAGYVERPDGVTLAFALLVSGGGGEELQVRVAQILAGAGGAPPPAGRSPRRR